MNGKKNLANSIIRNRARKNLKANMEIVPLNFRDLNKIKLRDMKTNRDTTKHSKTNNVVNRIELKKVIKNICENIFFRLDININVVYVCSVELSR